MVNDIEIELLPYTDYQKEIIYSPARFTITEASTKVGKTISHLCWLFEQSQLETVKPGWEYWWVAPIFSQAEIAFKRLYHIIAESGVYDINLSKLQIKTPRDTIIAFKSADHPGSLFGENVHAFVFDEYSRAKEDAWFALRTTVTYTKAKGKFIGNVIDRNWAWELARKAEAGLDPDFKYFKITAYDAIREGILTEEEVEKARKDLPENIFKMLYEADIAEMSGVIFKNWRYFNKDEDWPTNLSSGYGLDFGFNDPDAMLRMAVDHRRKKCYWDEKIYKEGNSFDQLRVLIGEHCTRNDHIIADAADARMINELKRYYNISPVNKKNWTVAEVLKMMQDYEHIITEGSSNLAREFNNYIWNDRKAGVPVDAFNHLIDAGRYYFMDSLKTRIAAQRWYF